MAPAGRWWQRSDGLPPSVVHLRDQQATSPERVLLREAVVATLVAVSQLLIFLPEHHYRHGWIRTVGLGVALLLTLFAVLAWVRFIGRGRSEPR